MFKGDFLTVLLQRLHGFVPKLEPFQIAVGTIEILILSAFLSFIYNKYIKGTNSENLVKGVFMLIILWLVSSVLAAFNLTIIGMFLKGFVTVVIFGLIVVFQPELRRFLNYLGQGNLLVRVFSPKVSRTPKDKVQGVVKEILETIKYLSKTKTGALIVVKHDTDFTGSSEVGKDMDAEISQELLLTIFYPGTPLHDGAVVIENFKIKSAGVLLPLTEDPKLSWRYGTRHRAAIGVSEISNCACIVVSEETGDVSVAIGGELKKYEDLGQLKTILERVFSVEETPIEDKKKFSFNFNLRKENKITEKH